MVSKKKRPPPAIEPAESATKRTKSNETAGTSTSSNTTAKSPKPSARVSSKTKVKDVEEKQPEPEVVQENHPCGTDAFPDWTPAELLELIKRMERVIPPLDQMRHSSRAKRLEWDSVAFGDHSADDCRKTWNTVQKRVRKFRLLGEMLEDAKIWAARPWTDYYRSQKTNRHPDMPRRPLSTYMLFYMATKDKVAKENPGLEMTELSKHIAEMYNVLPEKKKKKYVDMAALLRKQYEAKLQEFYHDHPELLPKNDKHDNKNSEVGPKRPVAPFKLFLEDKLKRHRNDPDFDKSSFLEKCKEQWRNMPDKKKVVWINWACEEEARYMEELKAYMSQNPDFVPATVKAVLTKEEKLLKERVAGKPEKPPNSGYSLYSRLMLASELMKDFPPKERMTEISRMWKNLSESQKKKYQEQVNHMVDQYKLEYATYLESLPEDKRQEELQNNLPKPRRTAKAKASDEEEKRKAQKGKGAKAKVDASGLYKGEPEPPPKNGYGLFMKALANAKSPAYSEKEAPKLWQMLPEPEKAKYRKKLNEMKTKYIQDYENFLNSLTPEELAEYSTQKESSKKAPTDAAEASGKEEDSSSSSDDDDDDDDDEEGEGEEGEEQGEDSGSEESSSDSESGSSDSSDSNGGDSKNSGDSSSSASDSE